MTEFETKISSFSSAEERADRSAFAELFQACPIPRDELLPNLGLFVKRQEISRIIFLNELYRKVLDVHGAIMEFGVRWGRDLALFQALRGMYEPYNYSRRIIGFDTFAGFPSVHPNDGSAAPIEAGSYGVTEGYEKYLNEVLAYHERESPISHIRKFDLIRGDVTSELPTYLESHQETIVALAYFDLDIYEPTLACLEAIGPRLTKGSIIGFDELNCPDFPGETAALREAIGLDKVAVKRLPGVSFPSYVVIE